MFNFNTKGKDFNRLAFKQLTSRKKLAMKFEQAQIALRTDDVGVHVCPHLPYFCILNNGKWSFEIP